MYQIPVETANFDFLDHSGPVKVFPDQNENSEQQHRVLHIPISLQSFS